MRWLRMVFTAMATALAMSPAAAQNEACQSNERFVVYCVKPSVTNPRIARFDDPHYVTYLRGTANEERPLLVFMPGTNGKPPGSLPLLRTAAESGYRVISLEYNDDTSIAVFCPAHREVRACSARFREMRLYGRTSLDPSIDNTRAESIVERLMALLRWLDREHPGENWSRYYDASGIRWDRLALAGQSQGAGMAAFLGKQKVVGRIILFSSPWDFIKRPNGERILAGWLSWPARTPPERWYAGYNRREDTAALLQRAYATLNIPPDHIRVFSEVLPDPRGENPYHGQGVHNPVYRPDWIFFLTGR